MRPGILALVLVVSAACFGTDPATQQSPRLAVNMYVPGKEWTVGKPLPVVVEFHNNGHEEISLAYQQYEWYGTGTAHVGERSFSLRRPPPPPRYVEVIIWYLDLPDFLQKPPRRTDLLGGAPQPREIVIPAGKEYLFKAWLSPGALLKGENEIQCSVSMVGEPVVCSDAIRIYCNPEPEKSATQPATRPAELK